jgi:CubicO group peptidase (beta-lactamase class C family)/beta-lactamase class A
MKIFFGLLISMCLSASSSAQSKPLPPDLDKYIEKVLATFNVPGAAVSIVQNGKVLLAKGYGVKTIGTADKVDENTLFLIASNSKAFTATALAMLVEEGKLKWSDKVIDHLPWFRMSDDYITTHLTIRDLLVHHSGLSAYAGDAMLFPPSTFSRKEILTKLRYLPVVHDFRTTYAYDNILYLAAGEVIVAASGMSWEDFIRTRILNKLGMTRTVSRFSDLRYQKNVSSSHARSATEVKMAKKFMDQNIGDAGNPAGGIVSTAADMAKWLITQLDSGRVPGKAPIFKPATTEELWKVVRPIPVTKVPEYLKPMQSDYFGYALGFRTYNYKQYKVVGHGGALKGFVSQIAMVPDLNLGISVLTNQSNTAAYWAIIYQVLDYYMQFKPTDWITGYKRQFDSTLVSAATARRQFSIKRDSAKVPVSSSSEMLAGANEERFAGVYEDKLLGDVTIRKEATGMVMRFANSFQFVADLEYFQYNTFKAKFRYHEFNADAYLNFTLQPDGRVESATLKVSDPASQMDFDDIQLKPVQRKKMDTTELRKKISAEFAHHREGNFAVAFRDLSTGEQLFLNEKVVFHAASTMKTPVLIETFKQAAEGKFRIDDGILIKNEFKSIVDGSLYSLDPADDSELDLYTKVNTKLPISEVLHRMITRSSNLATNLVIDLVGAENTSNYMRRLGANDIQVLRGVEDNKAFEKGLNNTVTAYDLMIIMEALATGKAVNPASSEQMIKILMDQELRDKIPGKLPPEVKVACKTGSITAVSHDSGIIYLPDGRKYVLVLLSGGVRDLDDVNNTLANVSRIIYDYMVQDQVIVLNP